MTTPNALLLDTSILMAYIRFGPLGQYIDAVYDLYTVQPQPTISVVTEGEIRALALKLNWGQAKVTDMERLLAVLTVIPLPFGGVLDAYARIDTHCERNGLALGKNDLWIAATAHVTGATLLTSDADFDPLDGVFLQRLWVDPSSRL